MLVDPTMEHHEHGASRLFRKASVLCRKEIKKHMTDEENECVNEQTVTKKKKSAKGV